MSLTGGRYFLWIFLKFKITIYFTQHGFDTLNWSYDILYFFLARLNSITPKLFLNVPTLLRLSLTSTQTPAVSFTACIYVNIFCFNVFFLVSLDSLHPFPIQCNSLGHISAFLEVRYLPHWSTPTRLTNPYTHIICIIKFYFIWIIIQLVSGVHQNYLPLSFTTYFIKHFIIYLLN